MKKLLFVSSDVGGTDAIVPIINELEPHYDILLYSDTEVRERFGKYGLTCRDLNEILDPISVDSLCDFISHDRIEAVITGTSGYTFTERYLWEAARKQKIPSYVVLDSWMNKGLRFSDHTMADIDAYTKNPEITYLPDHVFVMDEFTKTEMEKEGIPGDIITVSGQPFLQYITEKTLAVGRDKVDSYRDRVGANGKNLMIFAPDNIYTPYRDNASNFFYGYHERYILASLIEVLDKVDPSGERIRLICRPHPKDHDPYWQGVERKCGKVMTDNETDSEVMIAASDVVVGMFSNFLVQAYMVHKPVMSIQIGLQVDQPCILCKMGIIECISSKQRIEDALIRYLNHEYKANVEFQGQDARSIICGIIEKELRRVAG